MKSLKCWIVLFFSFSKEFAFLCYSWINLYLYITKPIKNVSVVNIIPSCSEEFALYLCWNHFSSILIFLCRRNIFKNITNNKCITPSFFTSAWMRVCKWNEMERTGCNKVRVLHGAYRLPDKVKRGANAICSGSVLQQFRW